MKTLRFQYYLGFVILGLLASCGNDNQQNLSETELNSWNKTALKQEIIDFVNAVTIPSSPEFVAKADRIAVFDNDGTLWNEKPLYIPVEYEFTYLKEEVPRNPELQKNEFYIEISKGNLAVLKDLSSFELVNLLFASHNGQKEVDYESSVYTFLSEKRHQKYNRPFKEMVYQPMVELVQYLQNNSLLFGIGFSKLFSQKKQNIHNN